MCTQSMLDIRPRSSAHLAPAPLRLDALPAILEGVTDRMLRNMALEYEGDEWVILISRTGYWGLEVL